jgi:hypothetical protein
LFTQQERASTPVVLTPQGFVEIVERYHYQRLDKRALPLN